MADAAYDPSELILVDQAETSMHDVRLVMAKHGPDIRTLSIVANIANANRMELIFSKYRPEYVFHAAAYKHVPMMEDNHYESIENNVKGSTRMSVTAIKIQNKTLKPRRKAHFLIIPARHRMATHALENGVGE